MSEQYAQSPQEAFMAALADAEMTAPGGASALFDSAIFDVSFGEGQSINGSSGTFTLPLPKIYIAVGMPYGGEIGYADGSTYRDGEVWIPFKVYGNTAADQLSTQKRLDFARKSRISVFSKHLLLECGETVRSRHLAYDATLGITGSQYVWRFHWGSATDDTVTA